MKEIRTLYYPHQGHRLQFPSTPKTLQEQKKGWSFLSDKTWECWELSSPLRFLACSWEACEPNCTAVEACFPQLKHWNVHVQLWCGWFLNLSTGVSCNMTLLVEHICCLLNIPTTTTAHLDLDSSIKLDHWLLNQVFSYKCESSVNNRRWIHISNSFYRLTPLPSNTLDIFVLISGHIWYLLPATRHFLIIIWKNALYDLKLFPSTEPCT